MKTKGKACNVVLNASDYYHGHKPPISIVMAVIDFALLVYYIPMSPVGFVATSGHEVWDKVFDVWYEVFNVINPFTTGAYILGVIVLLQFIMYNGWFVKTLLGIFYLYIAVSSLVVMMGMSSWAEAVMYVPHVIIIVLCIMVTYVKVSYSKNEKKNIQ